MPLRAAASTASLMNESEKVASFSSSETGRSDSCSKFTSRLSGGRFYAKVVGKTFWRQINPDLIGNPKILLCCFKRFKRSDPHGNETASSTCLLLASHA